MHHRTHRPSSHGHRRVSVSEERHWLPPRSGGRKRRTKRRQRGEEVPKGRRPKKSGGRAASGGRAGRKGKMPEGTASLRRGQKPEGGGGPGPACPAGVVQALPGCRGDAALGKGGPLASTGSKSRVPGSHPGVNNTGNTYGEPACSWHRAGLPGGVSPVASTPHPVRSPAHRPGS